MFKKYLLFAALILARCGLEAFEVPNYFYIDTPKVYTVGDDMMDIRADEKNLGLIKRHITGSVWSRRIPQYDLYSAKDGFEAVAKVDSTDRKYRVVFSIKDKNDQSLGSVEENWENTSYFSYNPTIEIYSADQELLAIGKSNFNRTSFTLIDPIDEHVLVSAASQEVLFLGNWLVLIEDPQFLNRVDSRLLILSLSISPDKAFHYRICGYKPSSASASAFQAALELYEGQFEGIEPTEEDADFVRSFTEPLLIEAQEEIEPQEDPVEKGFKTLMPLLDDNALTEKQKSALLLLMKQRLE